MTRSVLMAIASGFALCLALLPLAAISADKPVPLPPTLPLASEAWPTAVHARYRLHFDGIDVGGLEVHSTTSAKTYALSGAGKVSVLFGAIIWGGSMQVSGALEAGAPVPAAYAFDWRNNRKGGAIRFDFENRTATRISVTPPPGTGPEFVPLQPSHKSGAVDPVSAIMMLTKADNRSPCERRVGIFDGQQRYDLVLTPKRQIVLAGTAAAGSSLARPGATGPAIGYVCRVTYEPIAGHRANAATRTYAANRDVEVVLRRIPGSQVLIPLSVTIPTFWGTGSMVTDRIDITTANAGSFVLTK